MNSLKPCFRQGLDDPRDGCVGLVHNTPKPPSIVVLLGYEGTFQAIRVAVEPQSGPRHHLKGLPACHVPDGFRHLTRS
jgi:hypothetical protein